MKTMTSYKTVRGEELKLKITLERFGSNDFDTLSVQVRSDMEYRNSALVNQHSTIELVSEYFSEYEYLMKWQGFTTKGAVHGVENAYYLANDRDCWGCRKGEYKQIKNGATGLLCWELYAVVNGKMIPAKVEGVPSSIDSAEMPEPINDVLIYAPWCRIGEGKEPNLEAARNSVMWPEATAEQLQDKEAMTAHMDALTREFNEVILTGVNWNE